MAENLLDVLPFGELSIGSFSCVASGDVEEVISIGEDEFSFGEEQGSVTVMPYIFPGGSASSWVPISVEAKRSAIASSTACCLLSAT